MNIESLLKPIKNVKKYSWDIADEAILKEYTKIGINWEEKGRNIKSLTIPLSLLSWGCYIFMDWGFATVPYAVLVGGDMGRNIVHKKQDITTDTKAEPSPILYIYKKFANNSRLPVFGAGVCLTGKGLLDLYNCFGKGESIQFNESIEYLERGLGLLSLASSIYLKDTDPKLLDKESVFTTAYSWTKNKIGSLSPKKLPQPVGVTHYE